MQKRSAVHLIASVKYIVMFKIQIPKPCHADWSEMTPTQQGAFCNSCSKEVVDFTKMTDGEVQNYFLYNSQNKTCGHFRTDQIHRIRINLPDNIFIQKIANWKKFMAVILLVFGSMLFGCDVGTEKNTNGEIMIQQKIEMQTIGDTTFEKGKPCVVQPPEMQPLLGMVGFITPDSSTCKIRKVDEPSTVDGDIQLVQIDTIDNKADKTDSTDYDKIFTGGILLEKSDKITDTSKKKPASDTSNCKDSGYY